MEGSLFFALMVGLVMVLSAVWLWGALHAACTAAAIPVRASISTQNWNPGSTFNERRYSIEELAAMWAIGRESARLLVKNEPGVLKIRNGHKKAHTKYSVPESVAPRIYIHLVNTV